MERCQWGEISEKMIHYHDEEWALRFGGVCPKRSAYLKGSQV